MKELLKNRFNKDIEHIYFIGIGGSSMSGLAEMSKSLGFDVSGSDMKGSDYTKNLEKDQIKVNIGHESKNINDDIDLVVYSAAIHDDNPEMMRADELGIPKIERSEFLGLLSENYETTIGVAGTHGKTTTSTMIAEILVNAELDPSFSIGGKLDTIGGNARIGDSDYFVVESCEFRDSFLKTKHKIGVITNIEEDHLDYFTNGLKQIEESFHKFGSIIPEDGLMVAWGDSEDVRKVCEGLKCRVIYYGKNKDNDWTIDNISYDKDGKPTFDIFKNGEFFDTYHLAVPGEHNILDAAAAIIVSDFIGVEKEIIKMSLSGFVGAHRRFEFRGKVNDISVYEDYAHHPTELRVVIESALNYDHNNLWVVFQPHTYSRTKFLLDGFINAFEGADKVILNDIYSDREDNEWDIYSEDIAKRVKERFKKSTIVMSEFDDIVKFIMDNVEPHDLVLVAGSQTINQVAFDLVDALKEKYPDK